MYRAGRKAAIHALERVAILFWGCDITLGTHPAASKVRQKPWNHKRQKDDTNIHVLNWGEPFGSPNSITFPTQKWASNKSNSSVTSSCASCAFLRSRLESQSWNSFNPFPVVNRVSAGVPTLPDSGKTPPQLKTKFCISSLLTESAAVMKSKLFPQCKQRIHPVLNFPVFFNRMILNSGRHTQPDPQSCCVRSLGGRRGELKNKQRIKRPKTKLSSATPIVTKRSTANANTEKASRQQCRSESAPHPCHVAKVCDNNFQTIPNNIVLWQTLATCRWHAGGARDLQSATVFPGILPLHYTCKSIAFLVKLRHFSQKRSLQQSHFRGRKHIGFLDSKKSSSPVARSSEGLVNVAWVFLHRKSPHWSRERRQLIPHVRLSGSISGSGKSIEIRLRMCGPPLFQIFCSDCSSKPSCNFLFFARVGLCCGFCDFAVSFLGPPDGPKNGTRESAFLLFFY